MPSEASSSGKVTGSHGSSLYYLNGQLIVGIFGSDGIFGGTGNANGSGGSLNDGMMFGTPGNATPPGSLIPCVGSGITGNDGIFGGAGNANGSGGSLKDTVKFGSEHPITSP
jgi:hypothetical protein